MSLTRTVMGRTSRDSSSTLPPERSFTLPRLARAKVTSMERTPHQGSSLLPEGKEDIRFRR